MIDTNNWHFKGYRWVGACRWNWTVLRILVPTLPSLLMIKFENRQSHSSFNNQFRSAIRMYGLHAELNVLYINIEHIKTYTCMPILTDKTIIISYLLVSGGMYLRPPVIRRVAAYTRVRSWIHIILIKWIFVGQESSPEAPKRTKLHHLFQKFQGGHAPWPP